MKTVVLLLVGCFALCCNAQCSGGVTDIWTDLPFDTDASSYTDDDGTPLGFARYLFPGSDNMDAQRPCIQVDFPAEANGQTRYLTVWVESNAGDITVQRIGGGEGVTGSGTVSPLCEEVGAQTTMFEIICESSCAQNDYTLFYRVQTDFRAFNDEMFCDNVNRTYPSDLLSVPIANTTVVVDIMTRPSGGAVAICSLFLQALLLVSLLAVLLM